MLAHFFDKSDIYSYLLKYVPPEPTTSGAVPTLSSDVLELYKNAPFGPFVAICIPSTLDAASLKLVVISIAYVSSRVGCIEFALASNLPINSLKGVFEKV